MKRSLLTFSIILAIAARVSGSGKQDSGPLELRLRVVSEEHCQFTPDAQGQKLRVMLTFVNSSGRQLVIEEIVGFNRIVVARTLEDIEKGVYELDSELEQFEPGPPKNSSPITLKPGGSIETMDALTLVVVRKKGAGPLSEDEVEAGTHYLQIGETIIARGSKSPKSHLYFFPFSAHRH